MPAVQIALILLLSLSSVATVDDRLSYLAYLLAQKQSLDAQIVKLAATNHNLGINIKLNNQADFQEKWVASALRDQHSLAIDALPATFISLAQRTANCSPQNNQFGHTLTDIQTQLDQVRPTVDSLPPCFRNDYIKANFEFYQVAHDGLTSQTINECKGAATIDAVSNIPFLNTKSTKFVPNTKAEAAWVYGAMTPEQYTAKRSELTNLYGASDCPSATPFLDENNNCLACSNDQVYDISAKKCRNCESGSIYEAQSHQCLTITALFSSQLTDNANYVGTPPLASAQLTPCPKDKPFSTGQSCISCSLPLYFSFTTFSCQACSSDSGFDLASKQCLANSFFLSNLTTVNNYIGFPLSALPYDNIQTCPSATPFSNGKGCFACSLPQFFNFARMACQSCPTSFQFDSLSHSCIANGSAAATINSNLINNRNFVGKIPIYDSFFKNCEEGKPFFNGKECVSCALPSYFDFDSLSCSSCLEGLAFNTVIQTCEYIQQDFFTDATAKNIYYNGEFDDVQRQITERRAKNPKMTVCGSSAPFYNSRSNTCVACSPAAALFDFKNNKCMECPSGSNFSEGSHLCLSQKVAPTIERMIMNSA